MTDLTLQNFCDNISPIDGDIAALCDSLALRLMPTILQHLENGILANDCALPQKGDGPEMAYKITRTVNINGKQHWVRANTEQEYAEKLLKLYADDTPPAIVPADKHDFTKYALNWFELYSKPNIATVTAKTYKRQLELHLIPHFSGMAIEDITVDDIQQLFNGMTGTKATKTKAKQVLSMILDAAVEDGYLSKSPAKSKRLKITGGASKTTEVYSVEQMQYIIGNISKIESNADKAYILLQALHPLRLEEVLGLKWGDINITKKVIHVRRAVTHPDRNQPEVKETKTEASTRNLPLSSIAAEYLTPGNADDFVCGGGSPLSYTQVRRMCNRIAKNINFEEKITPMRFRPTVLTDIYDGTKDIKQAQAAAGHTTSAMTLKHYVKGRNTNTTTADVIDNLYGQFPI